jgi:hypothetical protein
VCNFTTVVSHRCDGLLLVIQGIILADGQQERGCRSLSFC